MNTHDYSVYKERRSKLIANIKQEYAECKNGIVLLVGNFERDDIVFRQESSFYYFTGVSEPDLVLVCNLKDETVLYVPNYLKERARWSLLPSELTDADVSKWQMQELKLLGSECKGFQSSPFFQKDAYEQLCMQLQEVVAQKGSIFTVLPTSSNPLFEQHIVLDRLCHMVPGLRDSIVDIMPIVARMRQKKDKREIELLYQAIQITGLAFDAAAQAIAPGVNESQVQASLEYMFTGSCARPAFTSIVASGPRSTVLHYADNCVPMKDGDLVVVDIGARIGGYCADITRTFPVSGKFTQRQKEIYQIVLAVQQHIAEQARPGLWLKNPKEPSKSLHHIAIDFLKGKGLSNYFPHGIGHFLGLDVHDVGDYTQPLAPGDVITIEPGIYIPEEHLGVRIEDDYWIVEDGVVCLSEPIPKSIGDIEQWVQDKPE